MMKRPASLAFAPAILGVCALLLSTSCRRSGSAVNAPPGDSVAAAGKQWRLAKDTVAADSIESYKQGADALRTLDAFGAMEVNQLFYYRKLVMVPAGTLVAEAGPRATAPSSPIQVRVLEGPQSGKILLLYPESAARMGFGPVLGRARTRPHHRWWWR
jgi:hypothetical protein